MFVRVSILLLCLVQFPLHAQTALPKHFFDAVAGVTWEKPGQSPVPLYHEVSFADDMGFDLKFFPKTSFCWQGMIKYSYGIARLRRLRAVAGVSYKNFKDINEQQGHYGGGITGYYYEGVIYESNEYRAVKFMAGISYAHPDKRGNLREAEVNFGLNEIFFSRNSHTEDNGGHSYSLSDHYKSKLWETSLSLKYLFRIRKVYIGPFLAYEKLFIRSEEGAFPFSNPYNLKYYLFLSGGIIFRY